MCFQQFFYLKFYSSKYLSHEISITYFRSLIILASITNKTTVAITAKYFFLLGIKKPTHYIINLFAGVILQDAYINKEPIFELQSFS